MKKISLLLLLLLLLLVGCSKYTKDDYKRFYIYQGGEIVQAFESNSNYYTEQTLYVYPNKIVFKGKTRENKKIKMVWGSEFTYCVMEEDYE